MAKKKKKIDRSFGLINLNITRDDLEFLTHQLIKRKHSIGTRIVEGGLSTESLYELGQEHTRIKSMIIRLSERM